MNLPRALLLLGAITFAVLPATNVLYAHDHGHHEDTGDHDGHEDGVHDGHEATPCLIESHNPDHQHAPDGGHVHTDGSLNNHSHGSDGEHHEDVRICHMEPEASIGTVIQVHHDEGDHHIATHENDCYEYKMRLDGSHDCKCIVS